MKRLICLKRMIYQPHSMHLGRASDSLALAYATLGNMEMAATYSRASLDAIKQNYGKNSVEAARESIKLVHILRHR